MSGRMVVSEPMPKPLQLTDLYTPVQATMDEVRASVRALWGEILGFVDQGSATSPEPGGKLLRPALCLLSAGALSTQDLRRFVPMAASMELFHLAALAHDDVVDRSDMRRGSISLNAMWSDHAAVLGGDYLVARGMAMLAGYGSCPVLENAIECIRTMAEGELVDFGQGQDAISYDGCLELARAKTASLFAVACSSTAILLDDQWKGRLYDFGDKLGTAFQIIDDCLDLMQDEMTLGKPSCGDITAGKKTLPVLFMREALSAGDWDRICSMRGKAPTAEERGWVASVCESSGALDRSETVARGFVDEAIEALSPLPDSPYKDAMLGIANFVLVRGF